MERYYAPGQRLEEKLTDEKFSIYVRKNPLKLAVNREIADWKKFMAAREERLKEIERLKAEAAALPEGEEKPHIDESVPAAQPEMDEEVKRQRLETETEELQAVWRKETISKHFLFIKGSEIVFFEFKEIIAALAHRLKEQIDNNTGKFKVHMTKFIEDWLLRRLSSFIKFQIPAAAAKNDAKREWPESTKDTEINNLRREKERIAREAAQKKAEQERRARETQLMSAEDHNAMSQAEIDAEIARLKAEEDAARIAREALEEEGGADGSDSDDDDSDDDANDGDPSDM